MRMAFILSDQKQIYTRRVYNLTQFLIDFGGLYFFLFELIVSPISTHFAEIKLSNLLLNSHLQYKEVNETDNYLEVLGKRKHFSWTFTKYILMVGKRCKGDKRLSKYYSRGKKKIDKYFDIHTAIWNVRFLKTLVSLKLKNEFQLLCSQSQYNETVISSNSGESLAENNLASKTDFIVKELTI